MQNYEGDSFPANQTQLSSFSPDWKSFGKLLTDVSYGHLFTYSKREAS
jgi:hypothetical protein